MADGEGNKPAISLFEQQEQHKRLPDAPEQTPAPYVLPYRPTPAVPPIARQSNLSATGGAEGSIRSHLSNASYSYGRPLGHLNTTVSTQRSGSAGGADGGTIPPGPAGAVGDIPLSGTLSNIHLAHLLAYTQQQLTQLQQVQALLMQHLRPTTCVITPAGVPSGDAVLRPALFDTMGPSAPGPHPISGSGAAAEQLALAPTGTSLQSPPLSLATGWAPPRPPSRMCSLQKEQSNVGATARWEGPSPSYPAGAAATGGNRLPVQHQESKLRQIPGHGTSPPPGGGSSQLADPATAEQQQQQVKLPSPQQQQQTLQQQQQQQQQQTLQQQQQQQQQHLHVSTGHSTQSVVSGGPKESLGEAPPQANDTAFSSFPFPALAPEGIDTQGASVAPAASSGTMDTSSLSPIPLHPMSAAEGAAAPTAGTAASVDPVAVGTSGEGGDGKDLAGAATAALAQPQLLAHVQTNPPAGLQNGTFKSQQSNTVTPPRPAQRQIAEPSDGSPSGGTSGEGAEMRPLSVMSLSVGFLPEPLALLDGPALTPWAVPPPASSAMPSLDVPLMQPLAGAGGPVQLPSPLPAAGGSLSPISRPKSSFVDKLDEPPAAAGDAAARGEPRASAAAAPQGGSSFMDLHHSMDFKGPELDAQLDANRKDLLVFPEEDEDDDDEGIDIKKPPWYKRSGTLWFVGSAFVATVLGVTGICMQLGKVHEAALKAEVFRWMYLVAGYVPIYWGIYFMISRIFMLIEWIYFRENLTYLKNLKENSAALISMLLEMLWFMACFTWLWCEKDRCSSSLYLDARAVTWRVVLCIMLYTLANVIKVVTAKVFSMHFYRTAHFKKLKDSLEKEYYLQLLSVPRRRIFAKVAEAQATTETSKEGGAKYRIRTVMERRSLFPTVNPLQRLSHFTPIVHAVSGGVLGASKSSQNGSKNGGGGGNGGGGVVGSSIHAVVMRSGPDQFKHRWRLRRRAGCGDG
ncbi:hypothetical protein Vretimale_11323 [Volvox reticuliferus]|uniref:Uncharacterized protein n=1 Tax=Volvox reticuliferus TaxID=1737510 RepID=A0A8J4LQS0_9CHLO|nr:hypothetical protein Vretimale_11323 [Volvox reticuliferus]